MGQKVLDTVHPVGYTSLTVTRNRKGLTPMRVIKTLAKQLELAARGQLLQIINGAYVRVSVDHVKAARGQNVKFYARKGA